MLNNNDLKKLIEAIKYNYRLTQGEIAERLDYKSPYFSDVINGRKPISEQFLNNIHLTFDVKKEFLLTGEGPMFDDVTDNLHIEIGKKIEETLRNMGITPNDLAKKLGVSTQYVYNVFNGKPLGRKAAYKWSIATGIKPNWFLTGEGPMLRTEGGACGTSDDDLYKLLREKDELLEKQERLLKEKENIINNMLEIIKNLSEK